MKFPGINCALSHPIPSRFVSIRVPFARAHSRERSPAELVTRAAYASRRGAGTPDFYSRRVCTWEGPVAGGGQTECVSRPALLPTEAYSAEDRAPRRARWRSAATRRDASDAEPRQRPCLIRKSNPRELVGFYGQF